MNLHSIVIGFESYITKRHVNGLLFEILLTCLLILHSYCCSFYNVVDWSHTMARVSSTDVDNLYM